MTLDNFVQLIDKLPQRQQDALGYVAIGQDAGQPRATLRALANKGLIDPRTELIYGPGNTPIDRVPMAVTRYNVPLRVHMAWAAWCAQQPEEEEMDGAGAQPRG